MYAKLNKERQQAELLKRRGKEAPIKTFEELISEAELEELNNEETEV